MAIGVQSLRNRADGLWARYRQYLPSVCVLCSVVLFWIVGIAGGMGLLRDPRSPVVVLVWLYFMLAAVTVSALAAAAAVRDLVRRRRRAGRSADPGR